MKRANYDVVVIGAGVAGLAASAGLTRAGQEVCCIEASNRVGGRIFTVHDKLASLPIELGAEFIHGRPPEIWELVQARCLGVYEHTARALHLDRGHVRKEADVGEVADNVLDKMAKSARQHDESFEQYLHRSRHRPEVKEWARVHVEGFNAARSEQISVGALQRDGQAADEIEGDRTFRILDGYDSIPVALLHDIPDHGAVVRLNCAVERVKWRRGRVEVEYRSGVDRENATLRCRQAIVTVPLGVLQAAAGARGAIEFEPEPRRIFHAARSLRFGQAYRVTFRFPEMFWADDKRFHDAGFLVSRDRQFFTWWTTHPIISPLLTAWMAGSAADRYRATEPLQIARAALASLSRILKRPIPAPETFYFHNWRRDPYFRGAYSYEPVDAAGARESLARPDSGTLYFAGEAAALHGHASTVHGAIASGRRAAQLVQDSRSTRRRASASAPRSSAFSGQSSLGTVIR